ncbi:MAG TPA: hypothetical protein HA271_00770 [Methanobacterium subterraneum]|uniref:Uncharacterized protein n=1 Tax=Methanobacterium subterraneum TaxID=59277 RepID=A0A7J4TIP7_9EURY|nr:hypothetical protein [Methanobacterium subterraneum]
MYLRPRLAGEYTEVHPLVFLVRFIFGALTLRASRTIYRARNCGMSFIMLTGMKGLWTNQIIRPTFHFFTKL